MSPCPTLVALARSEPSRLRLVVETSLDRAASAASAFDAAADVASTGAAMGAGHRPTVRMQDLRLRTPEWSWSPSPSGCRANCSTNLQQHR